MTKKLKCPLCGKSLQRLDTRTHNKNSVKKILRDVSQVPAADQDRGWLLWCHLVHRHSVATHCEVCNYSYDKVSDLVAHLLKMPHCHDQHLVVSAMGNIT